MTAHFKGPKKTTQMVGLKSFVRSPIYNKYGYQLKTMAGKAMIFELLKKL